MCSNEIHLHLTASVPQERRRSRIAKRARLVLTVQIVKASKSSPRATPGRKSVEDMLGFEFGPRLNTGGWKPRATLWVRSRGSVSLCEDLDHLDGTRIFLGTFTRRLPVPRTSNLPVGRISVVP